MSSGKVVQSNICWFCHKNSLLFEIVNQHKLECYRIINQSFLGNKINRIAHGYRFSSSMGNSYKSSRRHNPISHISSSISRILSENKGNKFPNQMSKS